jgi:hypothetical protein
MKQIEFLKLASVGIIDNLAVTPKKIKSKDGSGNLGCIVESSESLFKSNLGIRNVASFLKIIGNDIFKSFEEQKDDIIFMNEKSKFVKRKSDYAFIVESIGNLAKTEVNDLLSKYTADKLEVVLSKDIISAIQESINTNIDKKVRFETKENKLYCVVGEDFTDKYSTYICDCNKIINNVYPADIVLSIINTINFDCKFIIDKNDDDSYPIVFHGTKDIFTISYLISPVI